jgi:hypothetical protein
MGTGLARHVASSCILFDMQLRKIMRFYALLQRMGIFGAMREKSSGNRLSEGMKNSFRPAQCKQ